jgi:hypothetical protein
VRRASDGSGLSGLLVFVYNASTSLVKTVATGAGGAYSVDGLATGTYFARVALATGATGPIDYIVELYGGLHCPARVRTSAGAIDFSCRIASGAPIPVTTGAATTGIDFSLDGAATISGRVVADGTMEPVSLVPVFAYEGDVAVSLGLTDAFGRYTIPGLSAGAYRVRTVFGQGGLADEWYGGVCAGCPGTPLSVTVGAGAAVTGIDFSLGTAGAISGAITCQLSLPSDWFALPTIHAYSSTGVLVRQTSSWRETSRSCRSASDRREDISSTCCTAERRAS